MNETFANAADSVLESLTLGPTPNVQEWEVTESWVDAHGTAWAILDVNGVRFIIRVSEYE